MAEHRIKYYHNNLSSKTALHLDEPYNIRAWQHCGFKCIKTFVIIFNTFFWLFGWTLMGVGISLRGHVAGISTQAADYSGVSEDSTNQDSSAASQLCLGIGCITVMVVLLACCGAYTENNGLLGCYIGSVVIILCFEIGAITVTGIYRGKVEQRIVRDIKYTMNVYEEPKFEAITNSIDSFQRTFHCCGCIDYEDWYNSTWGKRHRGMVPSSCLKEGSLRLELLDLKRINASMAFFDINIKGCFEHVRDYFAKNLYFLGSFVLWIIGLQLVGLAFSLCLFCKVRSHKAELVCRYQSIAAE